MTVAGHVRGRSFYFCLPLHLNFLLLPPALCGVHLVAAAQWSRLSNLVSEMLAERSHGAKCQVTGEHRNLRAFYKTLGAGRPMGCEKKRDWKWSDSLKWPTGMTSFKIAANCSRLSLEANSVNNEFPVQTNIHFCFLETDAFQKTGAVNNHLIR